MIYKYLIAVLLFAASALVAQEQPQQRPIKRVEFRVMSWAGNIDGLNYDYDKKVRPLDTINTVNRSKPYQFVGAEDLIFFTITQSKDGVQIRTPILRVPYDSLGKNILILVNDIKAPFTCRVLDESPDRFLPGMFRFVNFSRKPLKYMLGNAYGDIPVGETVDVASGQVKTGDVFSIKLAAPFDDSARIVYSNRWLYDSSERVMVFVLEGDISDNSGFVAKFFSERYTIITAPEAPSVRP